LGKAIANLWIIGGIKIEDGSLQIAANGQQAEKVLRKIRMGVVRFGPTFCSPADATVLRVTIRSSPAAGLRVLTLTYAFCGAHCFFSRSEPQYL
jgi:hypothetical protein